MYLRRLEEEGGRSSMGHACMQHTDISTEADDRQSLTHSHKSLCGIHETMHLDV